VIIDDEEALPSCNAKIDGDLKDSSLYRDNALNHLKFGTKELNLIKKHMEEAVRGKEIAEAKCCKLIMEKDVLKGKLHAALSNINILEREKKILSKELMELEQSKEKQNISLAAVSCQKKECDKILNAVTDNLEKAEFHIVEITNQNQKLDSNARRASEELEAIRTENKLLNNKYSSLLNKLKDMEAHSIETSLKTKELKKELSHVKDKNCSNVVKIEDKTRRIDTLLLEKSVVAEQLACVSAEKRYFEDHCNNLSDIIRFAEEKYAAYVKEQEQEKCIIKSEQQKKMSCLHAEIQTANSEINRISSVSKNLRSQMEILMASKISAEDFSRRMIEQESNMLANLTSLESKLKDAEKQITDLSEKNKFARRKIKLLAGEKENTENYLSNVILEKNEYEAKLARFMQRRCLFNRSSTPT